MGVKTQRPRCFFDIAINNVPGKRNAAGFNVQLNAGHILKLVLMVKFSCNKWVLLMG